MRVTGHETHYMEWTPAAWALLLFGIYLGAVAYQIWLGRRWPLRRSLSFATGILVLIVAFQPSVHRRAMVDFRWHMVQHLFIGMLAPIGLVLGAPMMLLLRSAPKQVSRALAKILQSGPMRILTHPMTALVLNIGGLFLLYLTPLYLLSLRQTPIHFLVHGHFLLAGYLFAWAIVGPDPVPRRPGFSVRLGVLFLATALHAGLSKFMYARIYPVGTFHSPEQIQAAAKLMYYGGDLAELVLAVVLFWTWMRKRSTGHGLQQPVSPLAFFSSRPLL